MKLRLAVLLVALAPAAASARDLAPGTWQLSGTTTLGWSRSTWSTDVEDVTTSSFQGSGHVLYHVARNLGVGLGVSFSRYDTHVTLKEPPPGVAYAVSGPSHGASYQLGPAAAYRVPIGERVSLVGQASVSYTRADSTGSVSLELDGLAAAGGVGLSWFVVDRVSLDGTLAYQWTRYGDPGSRTTTSGVTAFVGASLYLGGS